MAEGNYSHFNGLLPGAFIKQQVSVSTSTTSGQIVSVQNPEGLVATGQTVPPPGFLQSIDTVGEVIAGRASIVIKTAPTAAVTLDLGIGSSATGDYDNLIDGIVVNPGTPAGTIYNNIDDQGTNGKSKIWMGPSYYLNLTVASGNANGLVADVYLEGIQPTGGP